MKPGTIFLVIFACATCLYVVWKLPWLPRWKLVELRNTSIKWEDMFAISKQLENYSTTASQPQGLKQPLFRNSKLSVLLEDFSFLVEEAVKDLGNEADTWNIHGSNQKISALETSYFHQLAQLPGVRTVYLNVSSADLMKYLPIRTFYNYSSLHCDELEIGLGRTVFDQPSPRVLYNASCTEDLAGTLGPVDWTSRVLTSLQVGMPPHIQLNQNSPSLTYIHVVRDALINRYGQVLLAGNVRIIPQGCRDYEVESFKWSSQKEKTPVYDEVYVIGHRWKAYYHSNVEKAPRLAAMVHFLTKHPDVKIHVGYADKHPPMVRLLGLSERVISGLVRARIAYIPAGAPCCISPLFNVQLLWLQYRHLLPSKTPKLKRNVVILIQRNPSDPKGRYFENHTVILKMVLDLTTNTDLEVYLFKDKPLPSFEETYTMFRRALIVVAPHGAGESNMLFSEPGTVLVEALCNWVPHPLTFGYLAQVLGFRYHAVYDHFKFCTKYVPNDFRKALTFFINNRHLL